MVMELNSDDFTLFGLPRRQAEAAGGGHVVGGVGFA